MLPILACLIVLSPVQEPPPAPIIAPRIVLDARFDDWASIQPVLVDPADAPDAFVDLGEVRVQADDNFVHLLIDFGRTVNAQGLDGTADIVLNADGDEATGKEIAGINGADLIVRCTPPFPKRPDAPGRGIAIVSTTYAPDPIDLTKPPLNMYDIGLGFAPTHAGRRMEFRIARGQSSTLRPATALPPLFVGPSFTGKVVFSALDGMIADQTDLFTFNLPPRSPVATTQADDALQVNDPFARVNGGTLRVVSWNGELGAIIGRPEAFIRTLDALQPDVVLFQELTDKITQEQIKDFVAHLRPDTTDRPWRVLLGKGGGDLRTAVLSKLPLTDVKPLELVTYADRPDRSIRVCGALLEEGSRKLLVASVHLKCCGRNGSPEDVTRLAEVAQIHAAVKTAIAELKTDGLVIAGDMNLVGSRTPLENFMTGLDLDSSNLEAVDAYQLDGLSNATWVDRRQPFVPGRLDYALYSDSTLQVGQCFVYDSWDVAPKWRAVHGTQANDTDLASDHLPIVFDLAWK